MNCSKCLLARVSIGLLAIMVASSLSGQEVTQPQAKETKEKDAKQGARLEFMRNAVQEMAIQPNGQGDDRKLEIKPQPLLRYNDPARGVADSAVWRVGIKGRPIAIVTSEVYGPQANNRFELSHEFQAIDKPRLTLRSGSFTWSPPPDAAVKFTKFKTADKPAAKPTLRLNQMKRLAQRFVMREEYMGEKIELRLLTTPIDRYEPSDKPRADGAIFAAVWGVNPEVLLFIETDGDSWSYAFSRSASANLWASLDGAEVWSLPPVNAKPTDAYSFTISETSVPAATFGLEQKP